MKLVSFSEEPEKLSILEEALEGNCGYLELEGPLGIFSPDDLEEAYRSFLDSSYSSLVINFKGSRPDRKSQDGGSYDTFVPARMVEFQNEVHKRKGKLFLIMGQDERRSFSLSRLAGAFYFID